MEADFSGWVTKAGLKCSDGRTIMPDAFKHQDKTQVPLVWQHGHKDPENVLGHVILENRDEGVYGYGFFNKSQKAKHSAELLEHKDISSMSIWANDLIERAKRVLHGAIREVSLVLSGANPGALIENVTIRHSDGDEEDLVDEAIIFTGLELEHEDYPGTVVDKDKKDKKDTKVIIEHADGEQTVQEIYESMTEEQQSVCNYLVGEALASAGAEHSDIDDVLGDDPAFQDVYDSLSDKQRELVHSLLDEALTKSTDDKKGDSVKHNVFDQTNDDKTPQHVISHDDMQTIVADAAKNGSFKEAVEAYAVSHLEHGIDDIDVLFPEAKAIFDTPEFFSRRTEWVNTLLSAVRKSPFSRVKTVSADLTAAEARAKGYIKGSLKKEEFFKVAKRFTTPQTVYKKQKLDRDDIIDITDFDVVVWMKGEMRIMLDEELARAILVGDGRAVDDDDHISEEHIRPVANDHELYTTVVNVEFDVSTTATANAAARDFGDRLALQRQHLRGSGLPTMYTTETYLTRLLLQRDDMGRKQFNNVSEIASDYRLKEIVPVEILEEYPDIVAIIFNPTDYVLGADRGGQVAMFEDFDIDYNQHKYLIETRVSGALVKLKSAMVIKLRPTAEAMVVPTAPTFDGEAVTIINTANVVYRNADTDAVINAAGSPYAVADGETMNVSAEPAAGFYFETSNDDSWSFTNELGA